MRSELADQRLQPVRNLATNPSFETAGAVTTVRTNLATNPNAATGAGLRPNSSDHTVTKNVSIFNHPQGIVTAATSTLPGGATNSLLLSMYDIDSLGTSGPARRMGLWVMVDATGYRARVGPGLEPWTSLVSGVWMFLADTLGLVEGAYSYAYVEKISGNTDPADTAYITGVTGLAGTVAPTETIWGDRPASGDFTYAWSGTVNASTSLQQALSVVGGAEANSAPIQSTQWASTGSKSLRIIPTSSIISVVYPAGVTGMTFGLVAGKTYTAIARCRLSAPLTGTLWANSRRLMLQYSGGVSGVFRSDAAPNVAGETEVRLTFTLDPGVTRAFFHLTNGASAGNGDVWWDDLMVVEGVYVGDYGDGNTPGWRWDGDSEASTSTGYPSLSRP